MYLVSSRIHRQTLTALSRIAVTASTGIAGVSIGGVTLHSWAGIGIQPGEPEVLYKKMKREEAQRKNAATAYKRWNETDVLIIDESTSDLVLCGVVADWFVASSQYD